MAGSKIVWRGLDRISTFPKTSVKFEMHLSDEWHIFESQIIVGLFAHRWVGERILVNAPKLNRKGCSVGCDSHGPNLGQDKSIEGAARSNNFVSRTVNDRRHYGNCHEYSQK